MALLDLVRGVGRRAVETTTGAVTTTSTAIGLAATVAATYIAEFRKDWRAMLKIIDNKIAAAQAELAAAEVQLPALALDVHGAEGDGKSGAAAKLKAINIEIERLRKTVMDLQAARTEADERLKQEDREAAALDEKERKNRAKAAYLKIAAGIAEADKLVDDLAATLLAVGEQRNEFQRLGFGDFHTMLTAWGGLQVCVGYKLRPFGIRVHGANPYFTADRATWSSHLPPASVFGLQDAPKG